MAYFSYVNANFSYFQYENGKCFVRGVVDYWKVPWDDGQLPKRQSFLVDSLGANASCQTSPSLEQPMSLVSRPAKFSDRPPRLFMEKYTALFKASTQRS